MGKVFIILLIFAEGFVNLLVLAIWRVVHYFLSLYSLLSLPFDASSFSVKNIVLNILLLIVS